MAVLMIDLPPQQRPRERLLRQGVDALTDRELLALLLRNGTRGTSALDLADDLLAEHGSLTALAMARPEELAVRKGVGPAKAATIVAAFRLAGRVSRANLNPVVLRRPEDVVAAVQADLSTLRCERVVTLVCDAANRCRRIITVAEGSVDYSLVPVREILNAVLRHDGRAFALAHNHPSGDPEPSDADRRATEELRAAARVVGVRFLGHVVVAHDRWQSIN